MSHDGMIVMYGTGGTGMGPRWNRCPTCGAQMVFGVCPSSSCQAPKPAPSPALVVYTECNRHFVAGTLCPWFTPRREDTTESKALRDALGVAMANLLEIQTDLAKEREKLDEIQRVVDKALEKVKKALK